MKRNLSLLMAAGAIAFAPATALAVPPGGGGGGPAMHGPTMSSPSMQRATPSATTTTTTTQTAPATPNSPTGNGGGYNHTNSPQHETGQPMASCETTGTTPGNSGTSPGSAFSGGTADEKYAGEQPQNSRNTASSSQYDVACTHQPQ